MHLQRHSIKITGAEFTIHLRGYNPSIKEDTYYLAHSLLQLWFLYRAPPYTDAWGLWGQTAANNHFSALVLFLTHLVVLLTTKWKWWYGSERLGDLITGYGYFASKDEIRLIT